MKVSTNDESAIWCSERGFSLDAPPRWDDSRIRNGVQFATRSKQSVIEAVVRNVVNSFAYDEAVVWITDWPLYQPDEMAVVQRFRASIGEKRWLIDAPGHIFGPDEINDCIGLFNLCVQYSWDAFLFVPQGKLIAYNSHDDFQFMSSLSEEGLAEIATLLSSFELRR